MTAIHYVNQPRPIPTLLRLLCSGVLAIVITFALFALMKLLITPATDRLNWVERELPVVELFEPPQETAAEIRKALPPKPELTPPNMKLNHVEPTDTSNQMIVSHFIPNIGVTLDGPALPGSMRSNMATPLVRVEPRFPTEAARQGISGWVLLNFNIDESGSVTDISILAAEPKNIFDREAIRALRRWKYQPQLVEGKPIKQTNLQVQLDFQLQQD
ncbi:protein TonB [Alishewanella longhuensis]|uniref:Protein TonB n=1 Tax=Alishewanella longhuensis TaxID=1091037 RepID=A0ABQ3L0Z8_9ALTE|nr:energy transducer TonB [Alishewanella longhuensis]GHG69681.1 protein TonB [Alishewanella longhuensis]